MERPPGAIRRAFEPFNVHIREFVRIGVGLEEPLPEPFLREVQLIRRPFIIGILLVFACILILSYSIFKGWYLLTLTVPKECTPLKDWLLQYCITVCSIPFCAPLALPRVFYLGLGAQRIRSATVPQSCSTSAPGQWEFMDEVWGLTLVTLPALLCGFAQLVWIRLRIRRLRVLYGSSGPASEAAIGSIIEQAQVEAAPEGCECCICLEEGDSRGRWLRLICNHHFHEPCLLEWLRQSRVCPLCRLDLHQAYLTPEGAGRQAVMPSPDASGTDSTIGSSLSLQPVDPENPPDSRVVGLLDADGRASGAQ